MLLNPLELSSPSVAWSYCPYSAEELGQCSMAVCARGTLHCVWALNTNSLSMLNKQVTFAMPALEVTRMKVTMLLGLTLYYSWNGSLAHLGKREVRLPKWPNRRRKIQASPSDRYSTSSALSVLCPPLAKRRAPMPTLKTFVILAFSKKTT